MGKILDKIWGFFSLDDDEGITSEIPGSETPHKLNLIPITSKKSEILIMEPTSYQEALQAAEQLKRKRVLVLNMENADPAIARRIIDFLAGISYAQEGHMENITNTIYLCTPSNMGIRSAGKKKSRGDFFASKKGGGTED